MFGALSPVLLTCQWDIFLAHVNATIGAKSQGPSGALICRADNVAPALMIDMQSAGCVPACPVSEVK